MFNRHTYNIIQRVLSNNNKYNLFQPNDTIVVGVSGGADSVCLLDILYKISKEYHYNLTIKIAHVNHGIRGESAKRDENFVKEIAKKYGYDFFCKSENVPEYARQKKLSEEEAGRQVRYSFFDELAGNDGKIATAHNQNDNAETVLMRFMRGTGLKGLCGIDFKRKNIIRPILNISRKDIEKYIEENGLNYITDETNLVPIYTRNKIRLNLIPEIKKEYNPNFVEVINSNIDTYNEDNSFLETIAMEQYLSLCKKDKLQYKFLISEINKLHNAIKRRVLIYALIDFAKEHGMDIDVCNKYIVSIQDILNADGNKTISISSDIKVGKIYENLVIFVKNKDAIVDNNCDSIFLKDNVSKKFVFGQHLFSAEIIETEDDIVNTPNCIYIPVENIQDLVMRYKEDGDIFDVDENTHKKLSKIFIDKKVPVDERNSVPIVCVGNHVLWISGIVAKRYKKRTGKFVRIILK